ncbi:putative SCF complex member Cullin 1 [Paxillus ammoniavirescens]|nr:putative SCF complex member Cullin 1 [Paxillus ammoniavirescens]
MVPSENDVLHIHWRRLEEDIHHIMSLGTKGVPASSYMSHYTTLYDITTSRYSQQRCLYLYQCMTKYFTMDLRNLQERFSGTIQLQDEALLRDYAREWNRYTTGAHYLHRQWGYFNIHFIRRQREDRQRGSYPVYTLAIMTWKTHVFQQFHAKISEAVLRLVDRQRSGDCTIDLAPIKKVVESLIVMGIDEFDVNKTSLDVYKEYLETPFLEATRKYFEHKSQAFLMTSTPYDFVQQAEECLRVEFHIARHLYVDTHCQLLDILRAAFLQHFKLSLSTKLLDHDVEVDEELLQRLYTILSNIPYGLETLRQEFEEHVKQVGLASVSNLVGTGPQLAATPDAKAYIGMLSAIHRKYSRLIDVCFRTEVGFVASLDRAFGKLVNRNAATTFSSAISAELLVTYVDDMLRRVVHRENDDDIEVTFSDVMVLFKYIEDKDVFRELYTQKFAQRQVDFVTAPKSEQYEYSMISKLKAACGVEYTGKLQRMLKESTLSRDLTRRFGDQVQQYRGSGNQAVDLNILILGTNSWPFRNEAKESNGFLIPPEIKATHTLFTRFYKSIHSDRGLAWLWNRSKNELSTNHLTRKYSLLVSTYQMAVLLQYNVHDTRSCEELSTSTGIDQKTLVQTLAPLVDAQIIIPRNAGDNKYDLNLDFGSKKSVVDLTRPSKAEVTSGSREVFRPAALSKSRLYSIRGSIIRIVKVRKTVREQTLIEDVISSVSQQFKPNIDDIKKVIETLLEDELIERVKNRAEVLKYCV